MKKILFSILLISMFLTSCIKDDNQPVIQLINYTSGTSYLPGDTVLFKIRFSDDNELKSYGFGVQYAEEEPCDLLKITLSNHDIPFLEVTNDITLNSGIIIPDEDICRGKYEFTVTCMDKAKNTTTLTDYFEIITDMVFPSATLSCSFDENQNLNNGDTLQISFTASDNKDLKQVFVCITDFSSSYPTYENCFAVVGEANTNQLLSNLVTVDCSPFIIGQMQDNSAQPKPLQWGNQQYELMIYAQDGSGNIFRSEPIPFSAQGFGSFGNNDDLIHRLSAIIFALSDKE